MAPRRIALLVAIDTYTDDFRDLRTPCSDAEALGAVLADPAIGAFEVTTLLNRPMNEVQQVIEATFTGRHRDDLVLLHLSGHGVRDNGGKLHFAMPDTRRTLLRSTAVSASWLHELIDSCHARRVVWLDCCYSGAFPSGFKGDETADVINQLTSHSGRGCAVMTAAAKLEYAYEKGPESVFTAAIVTGLRTGDADLDKDGLIGVDELYSYVYDKVREQIPNQTPGSSGLRSGPIHVAHRPDPALIAPVLPQPAEVELDSSTFELVHTVKAFSLSQRLFGKADVTGLVFDHAEPSRLWIGGNGTIDRLDVETGTRIGRWGEDPLELTHGARAAAISPDGTVLATAVDNEIRLEGRTSRELVARLRAHGSVWAIAFSPDGQLLASAGAYQHDVQLWDPHTHKLLTDLSGHEPGRVWSAAFHPGGRLLATASSDRTVRIWDVSSGRMVRTLFGHRQTVRSLAFSPDGRLLVSGGLDRTVRIWHTNAVKPSAVFDSLPRGVMAVRFNPAGDRLVATCADGHVLIWRRS